MPADTPRECDIRDELHRLVLADLNGPLGGDDEEFTGENPIDRTRWTGSRPRGEVLEPADQDELAADGAGEASEADGAGEASEADGAGEASEADGAGEASEATALVSALPVPVVCVSLSVSSYGQVEVP